MSKKGINYGKIAVVLAVTLVLVLGLAATAMAALPTSGTAGAAGIPQTGGTNGTGYTAPTPTDVNTNVSNNGIKWNTPTDQHIHSNYSSNTDACASCHTTHTGIGPALLKWQSTSAACFTCHDGTVTVAYNVVGGIADGASKQTSGGKFGSSTGLPTGIGASAHNVWSVNISAAPGGSEVQNVTNKLTGGDANGTWYGAFSCASCHTPHGLGGNSRILQPDPNGLAWKSKVTGGGLGTGDGATVMFQAPVGKRNWLKGYPYNTATDVYVAGVKKTIGTDYNIDYANGSVTFTAAPAAAAAITADYVPGLVVSMTISNPRSASETVTYNSGTNGFCGACHTDYNTDKTTYLTDPTTSTSGQNKSGQYRLAYRHGVGMTWDDNVRGTDLVAPSGSAANEKMRFENVNATNKQGKVICLTCHFAHGTDDTFNGTWNGTAQTTNDSARGTALKRMANMGVCEACHKK